VYVCLHTRLDLESFRRSKLPCAVVGQMNMAHKSIDSLRWDGQAWGIADSSALRPEAKAPLCTMRLATMNILTDTFPWLVELAIASQERFERLVVEIPRLDATVLGLNEVSRTSLQMLLDSEFVRSNYYVTELPTNVNSTLNAPHGCVLLSKLPFEKCYAIDPMEIDGKAHKGCRKAIVGVVRVDGQRVAVCSMHTVAYQTRRNMELRAQQVGRAVDFMRSLDVQAHFLMGDLNMHYLAEDALLGANELLDCWAETHFGADGDAQPGFTFDAETNSMITRYIPAETRRMRLDRILCREGGALEPVGPCVFWGHDAVAAERDIYLSDHYGLVVDLARAEGGGFRGSSDVRQILDENSRRDLEENPFSRWRFALALLSHVIWLVPRAIGLW